MTEFQIFSKLVHDKFNELSKGELFVVGTDNRIFEQHYLASFPEGTNPIFKTHTEHDCSCCKNFIRNIGNLVGFQNGGITSVWDIEGAPYPYDVVAKSMQELVRNWPITTVWRAEEPQYGAENTRQLLEDKSVKVWNHFHGKPVGKFYIKKGSSESAATVAGKINTAKAVLKRGLDEIKPDALQTILDLIDGKALYRGDEHRAAVAAFQALQKQYNLQTYKEDFAWQHCGDRAALFRNTVIGTLATDLSEDKPLEAAVGSFEAKVAPTNYKRTTALITPRMVQDAKETLQALGLEETTDRRLANIGDITPNNVLWVDGKARSKMKGVMDNLLDEVVATQKKGTPVEIGIEEFMQSVLPTAKGMELRVSNAHMGNFVTLTAPQHEDSGKLFKWDNDFAWSYSGNITDSELRKAVGAKGGRLDGVLRFSHSWNHEGQRNASLMDLHVFMPGPHTPHKDGVHEQYGSNSRVGWNRRSDSTSGGVQDVDYTAEAPAGYVPVENITFPSMDRLKDGEYLCKIHNWRARNPNNGGFQAEIEFGGQVFEYEYTKKLAHHEWVTVAVLTLKAGVWSIEHKLPTTKSSKDKWGVKTETYVKVDTVMFSPNYWDDNAVGNKHWFFMLNGCKADEKVRGIYNEFLRGDLEKHRKVFEVLGDKTKCEIAEEQLSGVGFSSTKRDSVELVVKTDKTERVYKVNF